MPICRPLVRTIVIVSTLALACSKGSTSSTTVNNADLPHFSDISTASAPIQTAAKAVVRIHTAGQIATGFFISATGQLLTNDHVLGDTVCATEGCYVEITKMYQRGQPQQQPQIVYAVPVAVHIGLDMSLVQLYYSPGGSKLSTPDYLTFNSKSSSSLIGQHITVVGHPEGHLKKWTDGFVAYASGKWFQTSAYILPGDSGSPVLDDQGQIVGLVHRGPTGEDLFTQNGANMYSIGTASEWLIAALAEPLPATMISLSAPTTTAGVLENNFVYLNAKAASANVNGTTSSVLTILGTACDTALARQDFTSPDELQDALTPCYQAQTWIDCRSDKSAVSYGVVCPTGADATNWVNRFKNINQGWLAMNGQMDYYSVSFAIAHLQPTMSAGTVAGAQALQQAVTASTPVLDFELAYYLSAFNINTYNNVGIKNYIVNYQNVAFYDLEATYIAAGSTWLYSDAQLNGTELLALLTRLNNDPNLSTGSTLYVEEILYQLNAVQ